MGPARATRGATPNRFPLSVSGRYLRKANGKPFIVVGDTPWTIEVQLTHAQIDEFLNHRRSVGINAILFELIEHKFSSQSPAYRNAAAGVDPFSSMSPVAWTSPTETYWRTVDYVINGALSRGIACFVCPAYLGFNGGDEGWMSDVTAASEADLQAYGAWLARRYTQGNIVWVMGGDYAGDSTERAKQWNIVTGMRTVRTDQIITGHPTRADATAYSKWDGYTGFNLNNAYIPTTNIGDDRCATAYGQGMPFVMIEGGYKGESTVTDASIRMSIWHAICSGACGAFMGENPIWGFGEPNMNGGDGAAAALASSLNSSAALQMRHFRTLVATYDVSKLVPKTDTSLVSSSLGTSGTSGRVCPALAGDGSFALVWTPSVAVTVVMTNFRQSSVRARWYDPSDGSFTTVSGSPFSNSGSQTMTPSTDCVLVLD